MVYLHIGTWCTVHTTLNYQTVFIRFLDRRFVVAVIQLRNFEIFARHFCIPVTVRGINLKITLFAVFSMDFETLNCVFCSRSVSVCFVWFCQKKINTVLWKHVEKLSHSLMRCLPWRYMEMMWLDSRWKPTANNTSYTVGLHTGLNVSGVSWTTWCVQVLRSPKEAFAAAMQSWREPCEKYVCLQGDYVEKWLHFQLPVMSSFF